MKKSYIYLLLSLTFSSCQACSEKNDTEDGGETPPPSYSDVQAYVTTANQAMKFTPFEVNFSANDPMSPTTIRLNKQSRMQTIEGFGAAFTGSTCYNLSKMSPSDRSALLKETFDTISGMGYSYLRISIGCSDFSLSDYTLCDTPPISNFALQPEELDYVIPMVKEVLAINSKVKIMASPWTPPRWMKIKSLEDPVPYDSWTGGQLSPSFYQTYATYFVKFIQAMAAQGITIHTVTPQNEPLNRGNSASLYMGWQEQANFIKEALGPAFESNNIATEIILYDHNYNYDDIPSQQGYPMKIYADADAAKYVSGAGFHAYGGNNEELDVVHKAYPNKGLYFTEISIGGWGYTFEQDLMWNAREVCIGTLNKWCKAVLVWNFMLDTEHGPWRPGGCSNCYGAIDISMNYKNLTRNTHYYTMAHLAKVIRPQAQRIATSGYSTAGLSYTACINPDGTYGVMMLNENSSPLGINLSDGTHVFTFTLQPKSVTSFRW